MERAFALLFTTSILISFWLYVVKTTTYLLDHVPINILNDFHLLKLYLIIKLIIILSRFLVVMFFPYLRAYNFNKLQPHSIQYIFLGYAPKQKGYICFAFSINKYYVSRHVIFNESFFSFCSHSLHKMVGILSLLLYLSLMYPLYHPLLFSC